ncbi:MAG TPA: GNAT family N-acetyltransferase, partial [Herpetosiphonaceae bacterium]
GFASVNGGAQLVQFSLQREHRRHGQAAYGLARRLEEVRGALVPSWDEFFLTHALDDYVRLEKRAYIFEAAGEAAAGGAAIELRLATAEDAAAIRQHSGDFFNPLEETIASGDIYVAERNGEWAGFGILARSKLGLPVASAGMFTLEARRRQGIGAAIIGALRAQGAAAGLTVIAGCWYYNHRSKQTLERAGMAARGRLLSISY